MAQLSKLFSSLILLSVVLGGPVIEIRQNTITLPVAARIKTTGIGNFVEAQRARARQLVANGRRLEQNRRDQIYERDIAGTVVVSDTGVAYVAQINVGYPPTAYTLLVDTGSSNTWVGADQPYVSTSTSADTGNTVSVSYGSGNFSGEEWTDKVTITPDLIIQRQSIGVASKATGFNKGVDGILGVGPVDLTNGTVANTGSVPTVLENLFNQGSITENVLSIEFEPTVSADTVANGQILFGGTNPTLYTGNINYVPITSTSPASNFWGIDQEITYGDSTTILASTAGIVDTGTTLILIATDAYQAYQAATGAIFDKTTGLLTVTADQYANMKDLHFKIGGVTYSMTPNAQIFPRSLNTVIDGVPGAIYLIVQDIGTKSGQGLDFINGLTFLQRFYNVLDAGTPQIGFATTPFTDATTN